MSQSAPGRREVAYRLFAAEFEDAAFSYSESDEERAPNYVITPTGARVNRLFAVGVLTEVEDVNPEMVRGRVVDPTGAFVTYAGQYQPEALAFLERAQPPAFLALTGKARTFEPDDGDRVYTSVRPESVSAVDAETRDRWVVTTAERTLDRIGLMASAIESGLDGERLRSALEQAGVDERLADGIALALEFYGTTPAYLDALRNTALDAVRVVAGERDEVTRLDVAPSEGMGDASALATLTLSEAAVPTPEASVDSDAEPSSAASDGAESSEADAKAESTRVPASEAPSEPTDATPEPSSSESATGSVEPTDSDVEATESDTESIDADDAASEPEVAESPSSTEPADAVTLDDETVAEIEDEVADFDPGEFELDEETRREVEDEFGTEFSTGSEVDAPGEAGIETPTAEPDTATDSEPDPATEPAPTTGTESKPEAVDEPAAEAELEGDADDEPTADPVDESASASASTDESVDLEAVVIEMMESLDDGDGADREALTAAVIDEYGVSADEVEGAIQDALMSGQCYEPGEGTLKSI